MKKYSSNYFKVDWVLVNELAIGPAPLKEKHLDQLQEEGIKVVFSLCSNNEANVPKLMAERFYCKRLILPDHKAGRLPTFNELESALSTLNELSAKGPVFIHCVAAMERSPMVCMAWLIRKKKLNPQEALEYLMQVHPGTNPLPGQLALLRQL